MKNTDADLDRIRDASASYNHLLFYLEKYLEALSSVRSAESVMRSKMNGMIIEEKMGPELASKCANAISEFHEIESRLTFSEYMLRYSFSQFIDKKSLADAEVAKIQREFDS